MQQSIRSHMDQIAATHQLGPLAAIYQRVLSPSMKRKQYGSIILIIVSILFFPSLILIDTLLSTSRLPAMVILSLGLFIPLFLFTFFLVAVRIRHMFSPWYVFLYPAGFIFLRSRKINAVRWEQVTELYNSNFMITLSLTNGPKFAVDNTFINTEVLPLLSPRDRDLPRFRFFQYQEAEAELWSYRHEAAFNQEVELIQHMEREILTRLFAAMLASYQAGSPVTFGTLQISAQGISNGKTLLCWDNVDQVILQGDDKDDPVPDTMPSATSPTFLLERLTWWQKEVSCFDTMLILKKGQDGAFWSKRLANIPNAFVLRELIDHILRQHRKDI